LLRQYCLIVQATVNKDVRDILGPNPFKGALEIDRGDPDNRGIRFGTFELNVSSGELRKNGIRLKLGEQPTRILQQFLARPGELVTREELQKLLWHDGTLVDFEHGLNASINKLRETLADSAATPRYIETVPRRGYRFIAHVEPPPVAETAGPS